MSQLPALLDTLSPPPAKRQLILHRATAEGQQIIVSYQEDDYKVSADIEWGPSGVQNVEGLRSLLLELRDIIAPSLEMLESSVPSKVVIEAVSYAWQKTPKGKVSLDLYKSSFIMATDDAMLSVSRSVNPDKLSWIVTGYKNPINLNSWHCDTEASLKRCEVHALCYKAGL